MEQICSVSLSEVISTLLLRNRVVSARDIVNLNSKITSMYDVDVIDDDIEHLFKCVSMDSNFNFMLRSDLDYSSTMDDGKTVREFLIDNGLPSNIRDSVCPDVTLENIANYTFSNVKSNVKKLGRHKRWFWHTKRAN